MTLSSLAPVLTGVFGIAGVLGGASLTAWLSGRLEKKKRAAEDARRWLNDQRSLFARYLTLCESMTREIENLACFLSYDGSKPVHREEEALIKEGLFDYNSRWDDELQPLLEELSLIASPQVTDLASRMSAVLIELTGVVELRKSYAEHVPDWHLSLQMLSALRNAMREDLGVPRLPDSHTFPGRSDESWPWIDL